MNAHELKSFVLCNPDLVSMRESSLYPELFVLKYKKRVFYADLWNEYLENCRGSIIDKDFNLVSYPFTKIYNHLIEDRAPLIHDSERVTAHRKVNGFMVAVSLYKGKCLVSTTGSLDSDFTKMAKEMMLECGPLDQWANILMGEDFKGKTFLFECVHPNDPHIIPEMPGMYLIGYRNTSWGSIVQHDPADLIGMAHTLNCFVPSASETTMEKVKRMTKSAKHEGYVIYTKDNRTVKLKSPHYLTSKWMARMPKTDRIMDTKNDIKKRVDEEYHGLIDSIRKNIEQYTAMGEQDRLKWIRIELTRV